jgi:hypothetical protein
MVRGKRDTHQFVSIFHKSAFFTSAPHRFKMVLSIEKILSESAVITQSWEDEYE